MIDENGREDTASLADELLKNIEGFRPIREVTVEEAITVAGVRMNCAPTLIQFLRDRDRFFHGYFANWTEAFDVL